MYCVHVIEVQFHVLTGAEKDLKEIMKDYVNGLWSLPWERNGEGEEEKSSGDGKDVDNESRRKPKRKIGK